jgi:hypothetical protein
MPGAHVNRVAFSPDGERLGSALSDGTGLIRDLGPSSRRREWKLLQPPELQRLWDDLAGADANRAQRAVWALAGQPHAALPFLRSRLKRVAERPPWEVRDLMTDLDSSSTTAAAAARRELAALGPYAVDILQRAASATPGGEIILDCGLNDQHAAAAGTPHHRRRPPPRPQLSHRSAPRPPAACRPASLRTGLPPRRPRPARRRPRPPRRPAAAFVRQRRRRPTPSPQRPETACGRCQDVPTCATVQMVKGVIGPFGPGPAPTAPPSANGCARGGPPRNPSESACRQQTPISAPRRPRPTVANGTNRPRRTAVPPQGFRKATAAPGRRVEKTGEATHLGCACGFRKWSAFRPFPP